MKLNKKVVTIMTAAAAVIFMSAPINQVAAAKGDHGVDWSKYQGSHGVYGYQQDKFVISQIGAYYNGTFIDQLTYQTQVSSAIAAGKRAHTYIYSQFSGRNQADTMLNYYLPKIQTPKGSIVALDVESGNPDTDSVIYALNRIKAAGYTAVLYGYKNFLVSHINLSTIAAEYPLWLAEYPDYNVTPEPNYNYFPSFDNVGIFQFTSTYIGGGLDGNVDLTGVTDNGYSPSHKTNTGKVVVKPNTSTPATNAGQTANNTAKANIKVGDTVKVNLTATKWANGIGMPSWVRGKTYQIQQVAGNKVLLANIMSWIDKGNVEILQTNSAASAANYYTVRYGDSWWLIANKLGLNMYSLAANNGKTINSMIYPGETLKIGQQNIIASGTRTYSVKYGDSWWLVANKLGLNMYALAAKNGKTINTTIYPGQSLAY